MKDFIRDVLSRLCVLAVIAIGVVICVLVFR